ncbi:hypothetical protein NL676_034980 [Syzygium grande]|nr:hypothetical protein NL676_034980 [Syzygium grande]
MENSHSPGGGSSETRETSFDVCLSFSGPNASGGFVDHLYRSLHQAGIRVFRDEESFDVYLNFRGLDTRRSFADHLYHTFDLAWIQFCSSDNEEELTVGEPIQQSLFQAIRHSKIAIPILSENYASSPRCLRELAQIVECHKTMGQIIMPVFLDVTPSIVRDRSHGYGEAIAGHRRRGFDPDTLREWEEALICVGSIPGLESDGELPCAIWTLKRLEELHASRCRSLDGEIPAYIEKLSELRVLRLGYSRIRGLPDSISTLTNLQTLDLLYCDKLRKLPKLPSTLISLSVSSKLMDTIPDIHHLVKLGELFLADGSQELVLPVQDQIEKKGHIAQEALPLLLSLERATTASFKFIYSILRHYKSRTGLPDLSYLKLLSEFELLDCALDELENLIFLASLNVSYCLSLEERPHLSKLKKLKLKDIKIKGCPKIHDIKSVKHLNSFEEPSSSKIEAESSSEVEYSKLANTEHSSFQGVKRKYKAVFPTDMIASEKDDCNTFLVDNEDKGEDNIPERKKNKTAKSIALAISDVPTLPPIAQAISSKSDESITETMGASSNLQISPSVGGSSTTGGRVKTVASEFSRLSNVGTKPKPEHVPQLVAIETQNESKLVSLLKEVRANQEVLKEEV